MTTDTTITEQVKDYYGRVLQNSQDLKTNACCASDAPPEYIRHILMQIDDEIVEKFYGCGSPIPVAAEGCAILDMGCGTGRDVYVCSKLVGESGRVIGVDMTEEQLEVARRHSQAQAQKFGYSESNVTFIQGYMEDLTILDIENSSIDVVISNCVINLSPHKEKVFSEIFRVLRPGGELYFSDIFADRRLPDHLCEDPVLVGECLAGAMYMEDFRRLLFKLGVPDYRITSQRHVDLTNPEIKGKVGHAEFYSVTVRAFKLSSLEDRCEDYGQIANYLGTIKGSPHSFILDDHHEFVTGKPMLVCGNTAAMISETRLGKHFRIEGDHSTHSGLFACRQTDITGSPKNVAAVNACC
jgi:SAM-dependent methyltransferase